MAKITNKWAFENETNGKIIKVGNNRTVLNEGPVIRCCLHGHEIVTYYSDDRALVLNTHGYKTVTTRSAMSDFLTALEIQNTISFENQEFYAKIDGWKKATTYGDTLSFDHV